MLLALNMLAGVSRNPDVGAWLIARPYFEGQPACQFGLSFDAMIKRSGERYLLLKPFLERRIAKRKMAILCANKLSDY